MTSLCDRTWPSEQPTRTEDTRRQHRCGNETGHAGGCRCRYCEKEAR